MKKEITWKISAAAISKKNKTNVYALLQTGRI